MNVKIETLSVEDIDIIKPLWEELNKTHEHKSIFFADYYKNFNFYKRKQNLFRSIDTQFLVQIAKSNENIVGYCISSIYDNDIGEIDSIFVKKDFRKKRIGDSFLKSALDWFTSKNVKIKKVVVSYGNEEVFLFYEKYGFFPKHTLLEQK